MPKEVVTYETFDGKVFSNAEEATAHEDVAFADFVNAGGTVPVNALLENCGIVRDEWDTTERSIVEKAVRSLFEQGKIAK